MLASHALLRPRFAAHATALLIAGIATGLSIRYNTFAAWATDSGAYLAAAHGWAQSQLFIPASLMMWAPWAADGLLESPVGHVFGSVRGTITSLYPLGYPLLLAAATTVAGPLAAHTVAPITAGLVVWCAFAVGKSLSSERAGIVAALLIASSPVTLAHAVQAFSDVPATALWAISWVMSLRPGLMAASASGASAGFAMMVRPNLAPLSLVMWLSLVLVERTAWTVAIKRTAAFAVFAATGVLLLLWSQSELYGHPLQSGYRVPLNYFFDVERVPFNAQHYVRLLWELHTGLAFVGLLYVPVAVRRMGHGPEQWRSGIVALGALGIAVVNYLLYLPYLTYDGWVWLRFLLPALLALFVLFGGATEWLWVLLRRHWPRLGHVAFVPTIIVIVAAQEHLRPPVGYERIGMMQRYLREVLPPNAVVLTFAHSAAIAAATEKAIVRFDLIQPDALDAVIDDLRRHAYRPVFVLDTAVEGALFSERFKTQQLSRLIWPARAEMTSATAILYYDLSDRDAFLSGDRWITDVLVAHQPAAGAIQWSDFRAPLERVVLAPPQDTTRFRARLEATYRDALGRAPVPALDSEKAVRWLRRYVRYRLHGCDHDAAQEKVFAQIASGAPPPLCARPEAIQFPPRNETLAFRRALEERLASESSHTTAVDAEGESVWTQAYLELRVAGCDHDSATGDVLAQVSGLVSQVCARPSR